MILGRLSTKNWQSIMNKPRLFCFTYAGGTRDFFRVIEADLDGVQIVPLEYAGHGKRHKEEFYKDFDELADDMFLEIKDSLCDNYALFGYSMGSIALVEVLKRIVQSGLPQPNNIFLAAHEPHTKSELLDFTKNELDEWVKVQTIRFGAVPEKLLNNRVFWRTYLPMYRADYTIIGKYDFEKLDFHVNIPATILYSETDTPFNEMVKWDNFFPCEFHQFSGTHFFIRDHHTEIGNIIKDKIGVSR